MAAVDMCQVSQHTILSTLKTASRLVGVISREMEQNAWGAEIETLR